MKKRIYVNDVFIKETDNDIRDIEKEYGKIGYIIHSNGHIKVYIFTIQNKIKGEISFKNLKNIILIIYRDQKFDFIII